VDVDRYTLNGNYEQVMLSGRELAYSQLPQEAKTWVNQRLTYTHGYGLVMSPVNQVTSDGLPQLYIKDIPPVSAVDLQVRQPAIYYGEKTDNYIFTGTKTQEFDYPLGEGNAFTTYNGKGGIPIPTLRHRLAYAYDLGSLQILISNYFTQESRIHYYLEKSLAAIFGGVQEQKSVANAVTGEVSNLAKSALTTYQKAQESLRQGNWAEYGRYQQELEGILQKLNQGSKP
jgi:uncharacterized membrane protein (UPF0182 family)